MKQNKQKQTKQKSANDQAVNSDPGLWKGTLDSSEEEAAMNLLYLKEPQ